MKVYVQYEKNLITWYFVQAWVLYAKAKTPKDVEEAESQLYQAMRIAGLGWDDRFHFPGCVLYKEKKNVQA